MSLSIKTISKIKRDLKAFLKVDNSIESKYNKTSKECLYLCLENNKINKYVRKYLENNYYFEHGFNTSFKNRELGILRNDFNSFVIFVIENYILDEFGTRKYWDYIVFEDI